MRTTSGRTITLTGWLARQRRRRWIAAGSAVVIVAAVIARRGAEARRDPPTPQRIEVIALRVDAADRIAVERIDRPGHVIEVALIGVERTEDWEAAAREAVERMIAGDGGRLMLSLDPNMGDRRGPGGELRAFAYLGDGRMINEELILEGLMRASASPHVVGPWFSQLESQARRRERGLWGSAGGLD